MIRYLMGVITGALIAAWAFSAVSDGLRRTVAIQEQQIRDYQYEIDRW